MSRLKSLIPISCLPVDWRVIFVLLLALTMGAVTGCGSLSNMDSTVNKKRLQAVDTVAVVSIWTPNRLGTNIDGGNSVSGSRTIDSFAEGKDAVERNRARAKPDFARAIEQVHEHVFGDFQARAPFHMLAEARVLESDGYQAFQMVDGRSPLAGLVESPESLYVASDRYRPIDPSEMRSSKWTELFGVVPSSADAVLTLKVEYRVGKEKAVTPNETEGNQRPSRLQLEEGDDATARVQAKLTTQLMNERGKPILDVVQSEWSDETFRFVYGRGWDASTVTGPALQATRNVMKETQTYLNKNLPK